MKHGGLRANAGRPLGRLNDKTLLREKIKIDVAEKVAVLFEQLSEESSPLAVMLAIGRAALLMGDLELARECFTICLPYLHARKVPLPEDGGMSISRLEEIANDRDPEMENMMPEGAP